MKLRKLAALLTALAMVGSLAACGQKGEVTPTPTPAPTATPEPETEELLFLQPGEGGWENPALNTALQAQGLKLTVKKYPPAQYADKLALLTAGGVSFDLFSLTAAVGTVEEAVKNGLAAAIAPSESLREKFPAPMWENASAGGKVYGVPVYYSPLNGYQNLIAYRTGPLAQAGLEAFPQENLVDAFSEIQKAMTPEGQEASAFSWLGSGDDLPLWLHPAQENWPFSADNFMHLIMTDEEGNISSYYESAAFKAVCGVNRRLYEAGLISDQAASGLDAGAAASGNILPSQGITDQTAGISDLAFAALGEGPAYVTSLGDTFTCVSKTSARQAEALAFMEWLYAGQENYDLFHYGALDKDYTLNAEGRISLTAAPRVDERLTGYRPYIRYGENVSQAYIDAVKDSGEGAVIAKSALFRFDDSALKEQCRLLEAAVREHINPIKFGFVSYDEGIEAAIEQLSLAGLREYVAEYTRQYEAFLAGAPAGDGEGSDTGENPGAE